MKDTFIQFEFNYASILLKPYKGYNGTSTQLLKNIISKIDDVNLPSEKKIIDRHENRKNSVSRKLVIISNRIEGKGQRYFGKIALIKNKAPMLWAGNDVIEEIKKVSNQRFIEITNYIIHFSENANPIIMFEFNSEGPRLSDLEYYIRQIAREYAIAKSIETSIHLKLSYDQLDKDLNNVFGVVVKINSANNHKCDWLKALQHLDDDAGYRDVRLELFFKRQKDEKDKYIKNIRGIDFARRIIEWLRKDKTNIDYVDDLKMSYQVDDDDNIVELDFLKNKVVSYLKVALGSDSTYIPSEYRRIVVDEFNHYLINGITKN